MQKSYTTVKHIEGSLSRLSNILKPLHIDHVLPLVERTTPTCQSSIVRSERRNLPNLPSSAGTIANETGSGFVLIPYESTKKLCKTSTKSSHSADVTVCVWHIDVQ